VRKGLLENKFYFQKEKKKIKCKEREKKVPEGPPGLPVDPKGNYQHEWRLA